MLSVLGHANEVITDFVLMRSERQNVRTRNLVEHSNSLFFKPPLNNVKRSMYSAFHAYFSRRFNAII